MKVLVAYDGSLNSQKALKYGIDRVRENGGELKVLHVFHAGMFIDYGAGPRAEEIARAESARFVEEAKKIITEAAGNIKAEITTVDGVPEDEILGYAQSEKIDLLLSPPKYKALAKNAPCRVSIIPGNIILAIDNTKSFLDLLEKVGHEALGTGSRVILLGIVPVHLYSRTEKKELERIAKETEEMVGKAKKELRNCGIEVKDVIRRGYPDEEILKVAGENPVMMIVIPASGDAPSELGKAASIILDDEDSFRRPVMLAASEKTA